MFCNKCGAMIEDNAQFCPVCGEPVAAQAPAGEPVAPDVVVPPVEAFANPVQDIPAQPDYAAPNANPYSAQPATGNANPYSQSAPQQPQAPQQPYGAAPQQPYGAAPQQPYGQPYPGNPNPMAAGAPKSKLAAGLIAIFIGSLGIHNFYLGYTKKAVIQLLLTLLGGWLFGIGAIAAEIWAIVDAVKIFQGQYPDANGVPLAD